MFLDALNNMEHWQAIGARKMPKTYKMSSQLFKQMIVESGWERYIDENGYNMIRRM